ncbi:MAG: hypothetical protein K2M55_01290 [Muribaculaceae bacterium]|nr:hypothetical protein [Muribaculaceae bacterium]
MRRSISLFLSIFIFIMSVSIYGGSPQFKNPDFDFPKTVADNALAELSKPGTDGLARLRYTLEYVAATVKIDPDKAYDMPAFIAAQGAKPGLSAADRGMFLLMQVAELNHIYQGVRWKIRNVAAPLRPIPDDIRLWNGKQFEYVTDSLLREAAPLCGDTPLKQFDAILDPDDFSADYFTTLSDFYEATALNIRYTKDYNYDTRKALLKDFLKTSVGRPIYYYWMGMLYERDGDKLLELYHEHADVEGARYLLYYGASRNTISYQFHDSPEDYVARAERIAPIVKDIELSLKQFPAWSGNDALRDVLANLQRAFVNFTVPDMCAPGSEITLHYAFAHIPEATFTLYALPAGDEDEDYDDDAKIQVKGYTVKMPEGASIACDSIQIEIPGPGRYAIETQIDGDVETATILATSYLPIVGEGLDKYPVLTADFVTGAPARGVIVESMPYSRYNAPSPQPSYIGKTDRDGILIAKAPAKDGGYLRFQRDGQITTLHQNFSLPYAPSEPKEQTRALCMSDRALYHPGDTIKWMAALARGKANDAEVLVAKQLSVTLHDANGQTVDTVVCTTDRYGRCNGSFAIPRGRLTGSWRLRIEYQGSMLYQHYFTVSDFRMPVFEVTVDDIARNAPDEGDVTIRGKATTFSGMPVAGAEVAIKITGTNRWLMLLQNMRVTTLSATTDDSGTFEIVIPASSLSQTGLGDTAIHYYTADITVTAVTAETASTSTTFITGKPYFLRATTSQYFVDTDGPATFTIKAYGPDGKDAPLAVDWSLTATDGAEKGRVVRSGRCKAPTTVSVDLDGIPAAKYSLTLAAADSTLADTVTDALSITTYNVRLGQFPPSAGHLFIPRNDYTIASGKAAVVIGTPDEQAYIYEIVSSGSELRSVRLHTIPRGFTTININASADTEVYFATVWQGKSTTKSVDLRLPAQPENKIVASAFRDRLVPGSNEIWTLRLVDGQGGGMAGLPMVATMYNKALDALESYRTPSSFGLPSYDPRVWLNVESLDICRCLSISPAKNSYFRITEPIFKYITANAFGGAVYMRKASMASAGNAEMKMNMASNVQTDDIAAPNLYGASAPSTLTVEESAEAEAGGAESSADAEKFDFRPSEVLQAFWKPTLVSDSEGNVNLVFTVPNANTTWQLRALAWTPGASVLRFDATAMANKPVMVQPNLPRFLRQGDTATIAATVFNNSDEAASVQVVTELFDIATGTVTERRNDTIELAAGASGVSTIDLSVAADAASIGYRVSASAAGFSDGEQAAIPVLESATTVMESTQFYLNPDDTKPVTVTVDDATDATLVLQYVQNPVWSIVKAMRGLYGSGSNTSTAIASRIFSYLAARTIVASNPGVAHALREWVNNPSEQALTSMLERNEDLKRLLLNQTPWVNVATDNSRRMATLASVLEPATVAAALDKAVESLSSLQNTDGGFSWGEWNHRSSIWATETVLTTLGIARSMGMLPADEQVNSLIAPAFEYLTDQYLRAKRLPSYPELTLIPALIPELPRTGRVAPLLNSTVDNIRRSWKNSSVVEKAWDVLILNSFDARAEAETVMSSIRQFAVPSANKGTSFPSVNDIRSYATIIQAYAVMGAPKAEIDALRQWVIVRAEATDNLGAFNPDYVIASILLTGSVWTDVPVEQNVTVNGTPLVIDRMESASGYFSQRLTASGDKVMVTLRPNGVTPSYGSIMSISRKPMLSVEARPGEDVSIEKRMLVRRGDEWEETDSYTLGERVRVQLIVRANRDMQYVTVDDERPAAFEPVDQLPGYVWDGALSFYRENLDSNTRLFIDWLPRGTYHISYDMTANLGGSFISGIATIQSSYAPALTAHSSAHRITVK